MNSPSSNGRIENSKTQHNPVKSGKSQVSSASIDAIYGSDYYWTPLTKDQRGKATDVIALTTGRYGNSLVNARSVVRAPLFLLVCFFGDR